MDKSAVDSGSWFQTAVFIAAKAVSPHGPFPLLLKAVDETSKILQIEQVKPGETWWVSCDNWGPGFLADGWIQRSHWSQRSQQRAEANRSAFEQKDPKVWGPGQPVPWSQFLFRWRAWTNETKTIQYTNWYTINTNNVIMMLMWTLGNYIKCIVFDVYWPKWCGLFNVNGPNGV